MELGGALLYSGAPIQATGEAAGPWGICDLSLAVAFARLGSDSQRTVCGTLRELAESDFGAPLHTLAVVGAADVSELEFLADFATEPTRRAILGYLRASGYA